MFAWSQDPFDATDNPGRTIMRVTAPRVAAEFQRAADTMLNIQDEAGALCQGQASFTASRQQGCSAVKTFCCMIVVVVPIS